MEAILSIILLISFLYKLFKLNIAKEKSKSIIKLQTIFRKLSILTTVIVLSSIVVSIGHMTYYTKILGSLFSLDVMINSFCVIIMFNWNHFLIKPCFGDKCNKCFCIVCIETNNITIPHKLTMVVVRTKSDHDILNKSKKLEGNTNNINVTTTNPPKPVELKNVNSTDAIIETNHLNIENDDDILSDTEMIVSKQL